MHQQDKLRRKDSAHGTLENTIATTDTIAVVVESCTLELKGDSMRVKVNIGSSRQQQSYAEGQIASSKVKK